MLKNYLDERMRRYAKGELTKVPDSPEGTEAKLLWNYLRGRFVTTQDLNMYGNITIKVIFALSGNVYCSEGGQYYYLIKKNIYRPEMTTKIIFRLAADDGIAVTRKDNQCVYIVKGNARLATVDGRVVYEFTYTPAQLPVEKE